MELVKNILAVLGVLFPTAWTVWKFWLENKVKLSITNITYYYDSELSKDDSGKGTLVNNPTLGFHLYNYGSVPLAISEYRMESGQMFWDENYGGNIVLPHKPLELRLPVLLIKNNKMKLLVLHIADGRKYKIPKNWINSINENISLNKVKIYETEGKKDKL